MEKKKTPIIQQQYMNTISMMLVGFGFFPGKSQLYTPHCAHVDGFSLPIEVAVLVAK